MKILSLSEYGKSFAFLFEATGTRVTKLVMIGRLARAHQEIWTK